MSRRLLVKPIDSYSYNPSIQDFESYARSIVLKKESDNLTWSEIAYIINYNTGMTWSRDYYRKRFGKSNLLEISSAEEYIDEKKQKVILSDMITQTNANIRRLSREETLKDIAREAVRQLESNPDFCFPSTSVVDIVENNEKEGILQLSDWHYGIDIDSPYNFYSPGIAQKRIIKLTNEVISIIKKEQLSNLIIVNLGDMIAGNIHLPIRLNSRIDVITQTIQVSELIANMIVTLKDYVQIDYFSVLDNHSRIDPNKKDALQVESLVRITDWFLQERLRDVERFHFVNNRFGLDIATFDSLGHTFAAVHGDQDRIDQVVSNITLMTKQSYDVILTSHLHHFSADEYNKTLVVANPSLMGTDDYAMKLRKNSYAAQNLIITTRNNPVYMIYRIVVE